MDLKVTQKGCFLVTTVLRKTSVLKSYQGLTLVATTHKNMVCPLTSEGGISSKTTKILWWGKSFPIIWGEKLMGGDMEE